MTTREAEAVYAALHVLRWNGKAPAVFSPSDLPENELPVIYGFNNGGRPGWYSGVLLAQDGTALGGHTCSAEVYMPHDLGCLQGTRPDRHEDFRKHYPDGYRMEFVPADDVLAHDGLMEAHRLNQEKAP